MEDCWLYLGYKNSEGYGRYGQYAAHRLFYEIYVGDIPKGLCVLHHCDNPPCVNPEHLFVGTHSDNMRDMAKKHRHWAQRYGMPRGEKAFGHKLTSGEVIEIRKLCSDRVPMSQIAKRFSISKGMVCMINQRKHWGHI